MHHELLNWVTTQKAKGFSDEVLFSRMLDSGYSPSEASAAIEYISHVNVYEKPVKKTPLIIGGILFLLIIISLVLLFIPPSVFKPRSFINKMPAQTPAWQEIPETSIALCQTKECFEENFNTCSPAEFQTSPENNLSYKYTIIEPQDNKCLVEFKIINSPDKTLINQSMRCLLDYELAFNFASADYSRCSGELYDSLLSPIAAKKNLGLNEACELDKNCRPGLHCFKPDPNNNIGECISNNSLLNKNNCLILLKPEYIKYCTEKCEHCLSEIYRCTDIGSRLNINNRCVECVNNTDCLDGYTCEEYTCKIKEIIEPKEEEAKKLLHKFTYILDSLKKESDGIF